jgi:hypothetical protein
VFAEEDRFVAVQPLFLGGAAVLVQCGIEWFAPVTGQMQMARLSNPTGEAGVPQLLWAEGKPPRPLRENEESIYRAAHQIMTRVGLEDALRREPGMQDLDCLLDLNPRVPDDGYRHLCLDLMRPELAFKFKTELSLWSFCGRLGSWSLRPDIPLCPKCQVAANDPDQLSSLYLFLHSASVIGLAGGYSEVEPTGTLVNYMGMAARLATIAAQYEQAGWLLTEAVEVLDYLEQDFTSPSPIRDGLNEVIREFEAKSGKPPSFFVHGEWVELEEKDDEPPT